MKARVCVCCICYVDAVPKRNRSYGAMELSVIFLLTMVSTQWPRIFT
jgi:hypothetical protein